MDPRIPVAYQYQCAGIVVNGSHMRKQFVWTPLKVIFPFQNCINIRAVLYYIKKHNVLGFSNIFVSIIKWDTLKMGLNIFSFCILYILEDFIC